MSEEEPESTAWERQADQRKGNKYKKKKEKKRREKEWIKKGENKFTCLYSNLYFYRLL